MAWCAWCLLNRRVRCSLGMRTFESVAVFSNGFLCFVVACRE